MPHYLLPMAPWLLCLWQARQAGATWWAVLITFLCVHLIKMLIDSKSSLKTEENNAIVKRGWPELLRGSIGISLSVYVMQRLILDADPSGRISGMVLMIVIIVGIMDYEPAGSKRSLGIISTLAIVGFLLREIWSEVSVTTKPFLFVEWAQFFLSMLALLVGSYPKPSSYHQTTRSLCIIIIAVMVALPKPPDPLPEYTKIISLLFILPAVCLKIKYAVCTCITPILDQICHSELYPLRDPKKAEARSILLMQQKQEILLYIMAWCVLIGLWAHLRIAILLWIQIGWVIMYMASLRRYSNVIKILNFRKLLLFHPRSNKMMKVQQEESKQEMKKTEQDLKKLSGGNLNSSSNNNNNGIVTIDLKMMQKRFS